mgnify:CR=1 FL=1
MTPDKLIESYKKCPLVALKMSIILAFIAHTKKRFLEIRNISNDKKVLADEIANDIGK